MHIKNSLPRLNFIFFIHFRSYLITLNGRTRFRILYRFWFKKTLNSYQKEMIRKKSNFNSKNDTRIII
jgi:hypothetical protein